ncbi:MAG: hypothetical protein WC184_01955 [Acidimicrobiia bacterium]
MRRHPSLYGHEKHMAALKTSAAELLIRSGSTLKLAAPPGLGA